VKRIASVVTHLLDLQKSVLFFANKTLSQIGLNECKLCGIIPALVESYGAYTMSEALLKKLIENESEDAKQLVATFREVHPAVHKFYFQCGTIPFITMQLSVPILPAEPPNFAPTKASAPPPKKVKVLVVFDDIGYFNLNVAEEGRARSTCTNASADCW
jgi:hypothetical protein